MVIKMNTELLESNWGGARKGAGRKKSATKGKQMWIPAPLVAQVEQLLNSHNANQESPPQVSPSSVCAGDDAGEGTGGGLVKENIKEQTLPLATPFCNTGYIDQSPPEPMGYVKATRKHLERLPASVRRQLEKEFGSLTNALRCGLYVCGKKVIAWSESLK